MGRSENLCEYNLGPAYLYNLVILVLWHDFMEKTLKSLHFNVRHQKNLSYFYVQTI